MEADVFTTCCCASEPAFEDPFVEPYIEPYVEPYAAEYELPFVEPYIADDWSGELAPAPAPAPADPTVVAAPAPAVVLDEGPFGDGSGFYTGEVGGPMAASPGVVSGGPFGDGSGFYTGEVGGSYSTTTGAFDSWRSFGMPESGVPHPAFVAAQAAVPVIKTPAAWGLGEGSSYTFPGSTGVAFPRSQSIADIQNANLVTLQQMGIAHRTGQQAHSANMAGLYGW
jgi:hypothetical protein